MQRGQGEMQLDVAKRLVDYAHGCGASAVQLTGGEPMCYSHIHELLKYISSCGMYSMLATSGYRHSEAAYLKLKKSGLTAICISVNDLNSSFNSSTRSAFDEAVSAISSAYEAELPCFVNTVLTDENIERMSEIRDMLESRGAVGMNILKPLPSYDGSYRPTLSRATIQTMYSLAREDDFFSIENCFMSYNKACSDVGKTMFFANVDGSVSPCSNLTRYKYRDFEELTENRHIWQKESCCVE